MIDGIVRAHQGQCGLVVEVAPRALHLLVRLGQEHHRFAPAVAALRSARAPPLSALQVQLRPAADAPAGGPATIGGRAARHPPPTSPPPPPVARPPPARPR